MGIPAEALLPFIFGNSGGGGASGDSAFIPSIGSLATISTGTSWSGDDPYTSTVTLTGYTVTGNTMVSVLPSSDVIEQMVEDGTTNIFISNNNGTLTANAIGAAPTAAMTLHVLCTESDASAELGNLPNIVGDGVLETLQATDLTDAINQLSSDLDDAKNAIDEKAPIIINTALGDIVTFADGADDMPIKHLVANIEPVQSGTGDPSPTNVRPISGWTGLNGQISNKNLVPSFLDEEKTAYGLTLTPNADGSIRVHGTATNTSAVLLNMKTVSIPVKAGTYTINCGINDSNNKVYVQVVYAESSPFYSRVAPQTKTMANNFVVNRLDIGINAANGETIDVTLYPQFEVGSAATEYVKHQGNTISVSWQSEAGTVYGGTLDVVTGVLTVSHAIVEFDGSSDEQWGIGSYENYRIRINGMPVVSASTMGILACNRLKPIAFDDRGSTTVPCIMCEKSEASIELRRLTTLNITTVAELRTWLSNNPVSAVYHLATPQTYQLDPVTVNTLLGNNTVYVDCGSVTVDYPADTGIVVAEQSNAIDQLEDQVVTDVTVSGTIVTITAEANKRYLCGTVASIDVTPCVSGAFDIIFTSGSTAAILTIPNTVKWQDSSFDPTALDTSTTYEISVADGTLGLVAKWT